MYASAKKLLRPAMYPPPSRRSDRVESSTPSLLGGASSIRVRSAPRAPGVSLAARTPRARRSHESKLRKTSRGDRHRSTRSNVPRRATIAARAPCWRNRRMRPRATSSCATTGNPRGRSAWSGKKVRAWETGFCVAYRLARVVATSRARRTRTDDAG
jgi:hypothetical protein